jgi:hypothetical protein
MSTTVQDILNAAYAKSARNRPGQLADETSELLPLVSRTLGRLYSRAAALNWRRFGKRSVEPYDAALGGWAFPTDALLVKRLEVTSGLTTVPVIEVPPDNRTADTARASVYALGKVFYGAGNAGDPTAGNLIFFYAKSARTLSALTGDPNGTIDPTWPEEFNELLILPVAVQLARKQGGREGEVADLLGELQQWLEAFDEHVSLYTGTMTTSGA